jgi:nitroreductase
MDFQALIERRYSVRAYRPDAVDEADLDAVLRAAVLAPTAANLQPIRVVVLRTEGRQADLARVYPKPWFSQAPLVLAVCAVPAEGWVRRFDAKNHAEIDAAIVMDHVVLAATDRGLGTCWVCHFDPAAARDVLAVPAGWVPIAFTPLGRAADEPRERKRRPRGELVVER